MSKEVFETTRYVSEFAEVETGNDYFRSGREDSGFTVPEGTPPFPDREAEYEPVEVYRLDQERRIDEAVMAVIHRCRRTERGGSI